jgi:aldehyde dehydrogenase (NAD+)
MEFLKKLGIKDHNFGASTGTKWFQTKDQGELKIYSPADGKFIASVYLASAEDYEKNNSKGKGILRSVEKNACPQKRRNS